MAYMLESRGETVIEYPAAGATYFRDEYGVYLYDQYPAGSVLAGHQRRTFLDSFDTLAEARAAHPGAAWYGPRSGYADWPIPAEAPEWFDQDAAGEAWLGD